MSKHETKDQVIKNKKKSIIQLNNLLERYIANDNTLRKADLISKWLKDYTHYLEFEDTFDPKRNISYKRGNIVKVNLGFNLGSELGGVHYAVVIDNHNKHSSDTITVLPLSSAKEGKAVYERDLSIGTEFFDILNARFTDIGKSLNAEIHKTNEIMQFVSSLNEIYKDENLSGEKRLEIKTAADKLSSECSQTLENLNSQIDVFTKNKKELELMKTGSIVKIEQIRTISKMRIWIPKSKKDPLYDISLSQPTMDKINKKLIELFIFGNNS